MVVIFLLSSQTRVSITREFFVDFVIFKSAHMVEYGLLFFLIYRALYKASSIQSKNQLVVAFILAVLYAMSDELHQRFVPTRDGTIRDVLIDTAGITMVYLLIKKQFNQIKKFL